MVQTSNSDYSFQLSIKSVECTLDPGVIHTGFEVLSGSVIRLSGLEQTTFDFDLLPQRPPSGTLPDHSTQPNRYVGLRFNIPLNRFRVVIRCLENWLDRTKQNNRFEFQLSPAHTITIQTNQAKVLAQILPLGEALLPPEEVYLTQAKDYVNTFGELTPAAKANLLLLRHQLSLSHDEADDLNARAMGPFKSLADKYQHFRKELLACKQEMTLDEDFWQVMRDKATNMSLPEADAEFLKAERLHTLRSEAERARQQAEAEVAAEHQRQQQQQQRLINYCQSFEALVVETLNPISLWGPEPDAFRRQILAQLSASELNRGRLIQGRDFYHLSSQETDALEKTVLDELYMLSGLL
ncbi:hypothetical protein IQ254_10195 [Nodosilinea sp. LEGE 07088]|uniref:hypothetical protein n=1 Tax=Nodosilinea sp. LEGE 07088 TaxID=2777968 RepID=UPI0018802021|nr:hypothetical protein [Nodosilinea sp. LEGE 07088]MBE9137578.1 hypothetical protein [Nodosilinea sp. LEGE 07088]